MYRSPDGDSQARTARRPDRARTMSAGLVPLSACSLEETAHLVGWLFRRVYDRQGCIIGGVSEVLLDRASLSARFLEVSEHLTVSLGQQRFLIPVEWVAYQQENQVFLHLSHHGLSAQHTEDTLAPNPRLSRGDMTDPSADVSFHVTNTRVLSE